MKNKKKLLVLSVFVVLAIIFSVVYVVAVGNHYTLHTKTFLGTEQLPRLEIKLRYEWQTPEWKTRSLSLFLKR